MRTIKYLAAILGLAVAYVASGCASVKQDGTSIATAVVLKVEHQAETPAAEWAWLHKHHPGARPLPPPPASSPSNNDEGVVVFAHALQIANGRYYSALTGQLPDGTARTFYFDITRSVGK